MVLQPKFNMDEIDVSRQDIGFKQILFQQILNITKALAYQDYEVMNNLMVGLKAMLNPISDKKFREAVQDYDDKHSSPSYDENRERLQTDYSNIFNQLKARFTLNRNLMLFEELIALMDRKNLLLDREGEEEIGGSG